MPAVEQLFSVNASAYLSGIEEMVTATDELAASIDRAAEASARMDASGVGGGATAAADDEAAAAATRLSEAETAAADGAKAQMEAMAALDASVQETVAACDEAAVAIDRETIALREQGTAAEDTSAKTSTMGSGAKTAFLGLAAGIAYSVVEASKFQTQVTRLYTAAGLTGASMAKVSQSIIQVGDATGFTGTQIAEAMYHPISAGLSLQAALAAVAQGAELAQIHGANLDDTMYALSSIMKAFSIGASGAAHTAGLLNAIVGQGDTRFQDFNQSVKNWAPTASSMGISIQSMGAALDYLTDRGNSAEVASTRVTMGLSMVTAGSKEANTFLSALGLTSASVTLKNKTLADVMNSYGLTTNRIASDLKKPDGIYVALHDLQGAFKASGLSASQADQVMAKLFGGGRSDKAILSLMSNLDGLRDKYNKISGAVSGYGSSWAKTQETVTFQAKKARGDLENLAITFGEVLLPTVLKVLTAFGKFFSFIAAHPALAKLAGAIIAVAVAAGLLSGVEHALSAVMGSFVRLWETGGKVISLIGKIPDAASSLVSVMGKVASGIGSAFSAIVSGARAAFTAIAEAAAANPVIAIVIGIALLVIAFMELWKHCAAFRDFWKDAWRDIKQWAADAWHFLDSGVFRPIEKAVDSVVSFVSSHWKLLAIAILGPIGIVVVLLATYWRQVEDAAKAAWAIISAVIKIAMTVVVTVVKVAMASVEDIWRVAWGLVSDIAKTVWNVITAYVRSAMNMVRDTIALVLAVITGHWSQAWSDLKRLAHDAIAGVLSIVGALLRGFVGTMRDLGVNLIMGFINGIESMLGSVESAAENIGKTAVNAVKSFLGSLSPSKKAHIEGQNFAQGLINGMDASRGMVGAAAGRLAGAMSTGASGSAAAGAAGGAGGGSATFNLTVNGFVGNEQQLATALQPILQKATLQYQRRNSSNGLALANR